MSSSYDLHLHNRPIKERVSHLGAGFKTTTIRLISESQAGEPRAQEQVCLFVKDDRLMELSLLFHRIARDLGALVPHPDTCCRDEFIDLEEDNWRLEWEA